MNAEKKKSKRFIPIILSVLLLCFCFAPVVRDSYSSNTCGDTDEEIQLFLEKYQKSDVELLKANQNGRIKAVIYEREDMGKCIAIFNRKLFGLRWEYDGMDTLVASGLQAEGNWQKVGPKGSKCCVVVCGDNRSGKVGSYVLREAESVARSGLESDYIIDIYILDGISEHPGGLQQYAPDGSVPYK